MTATEPIVVRGLPGHVYAAGRLSTRKRPLHLASCWCWHIAEVEQLVVYTPPDLPPRWGSVARLQPRRWRR